MNDCQGRPVWWANTPAASRYGGRAPTARPGAPAGRTLPRTCGVLWLHTTCPPFSPAAPHPTREFNPQVIAVDAHAGQGMFIAVLRCNPRCRPGVCPGA